ncbi:P2X purinoceptor 7-like isoform X2 [Xenopus laevis]|uniref:P2X purinoceptor 7-like isoform X2 n=1 Tax=Xenopus laevis TaxID=8355 RepID=A0A8J1KT32_XENLA|nr:P2X purinoceptor 7-like isoform X2 [Xenopus laevis]
MERDCWVGERLLGGRQAAGKKRDCCGGETVIMAPKKLILLSEKEPEAQRTNMQSQGQGDPTCFGNEPVRDTPSVRDRPSGRHHQTADNRIGTTEWCRCGNCVPMKTVEESSCCMEVSSVENKYLQHGCICHSRKFYLRKLRQTSYRSFIAWIYGYLGPKKRVPIPACVVQKVRSSYPDPKGRYRGFLQAFDYNAFDMALD